MHGNSIIATPETCRRVSCTLEIPYLTTMVKLDKETDKAAFKEENINEWKNENYLDDFDAIRRGKKEDKDRYLCG